jgi:hypothetical protein
MHFPEYHIINHLDYICPFLVAIINLSLNLQSYNRINRGVADDIFKMPLYCINPVFFKKKIFGDAVFMRSMQRLIHIINKMIRNYASLKYFKTILTFQHK